MDAVVLWSLALVATLLALFIARLFKKRVKHLTEATGFILWQSVDNWVDFIVYPAVLVALGPLKGFATMVVFTLMLNLTYMAINKHTETDWTFIERINGFSWVKRVTGWNIGGWSPGKAIIFFVLSLKFDSFIATSFLFGKKINFRSVKFWAVFIISHILANLLWAGGWEAILLSVKAIVGT
jgi:hypothetical protein